MYLAIFSVFFVVGVIALRKKEFLVNLPFSKDYSLIGKGLAIAIVVYGHLGEYFHIRYLTPLGGIGVAMFLILSGYGINESWKKNGYQDYWKKRFVSVYIPYLIIEVATIPLRGGYSSVWDVLGDLTAVHSKYYLGWYITYQLAWYALYYFGMRFIKDQKVRYSAWILIGLVILLFMRMLYARQALTFILGVALSDYKSWFAVLKKNKVICGIAVLAIMLLGIKQIPIFRTTPAQIQNCLDMLMATCFAVSLLIIPATVGKRLLTPLYYLGIISYEIYLTHGYILWMVDLTFTNALVFYALTIGVAALGHIAIKRIQRFLTDCLLQKDC